MSQEIIPSGVENPIAKMGIEPWAIKSLPKERRLKFLTEVVRVLTKHHHPDLYQSPEEQQKHGSYLATINAALDTLKSDSFAREDAYNGFNTEQHPLVRAQLQIEKLRHQIAQLESRPAPTTSTQSIDSAVTKISEMFDGIRRAESLAVKYRTPLQSKLEGMISFAPITEVDAQAFAQVKSEPKSAYAKFKEFFSKYIDEANQYTGKVKGLVVRTPKGSFEMVGSVLYETLSFVDDFNRFFSSRIPPQSGYERTNGRFISPVIDTVGNGLCIFKMNDQNVYFPAAVTSAVVGLKQRPVKQESTSDSKAQ